MPTCRVIAFSTLLVVATLRAHPATLYLEHRPPETPAGHQLTAWLAAFNTGDRKALDQYLARGATEKFRSKMPAEQQLRDQQYVGRFYLAEVEKSGPLQLTGLLESGDTGDLFEVVLDVTPDDAHQLDSITLTPRPPAAPLAARLDETALKVALKARLDEWVREDRFSGSVLLAQQGRIVFSGAYGYSDRSKKQFNTLDTRFRLGSINKAFTAIAVLQQVQAENIQLTQPVGVYLKDFPNKPIADKVTIDQLLTHTGGTGDFFGSEFIDKHAQLNGLDDYLAINPMRGLDFEPGSQTQYSNYGYIILGSIIEHVSGENYFDYIRKHVYGPAGMTSSDTPHENQAVANRALGYTKPLGTTIWLPNTDTLPNRGSSAGGGLSTTGDMLRFARALLSNKLLSAEYTNLAITAKPIPAYRGPPIGYGFADLRGPDGSGWIGGNGGAEGMNAHFKIYPKSGYIIVVLSNFDPPAADRVAEFIDRRLNR